MSIATESVLRSAASSPVALAAKAAQTQTTRVGGAAFEYTQTRVLPAVRQAMLSNLGIMKSDRSELAESFKMLRNQLLQRMRSRDQRVIAVTSARVIEGKSLAAMNLAQAIAADFDSSALLIDADLQGKGLQTLLDLDGTPGLSDHLVDAAPLSSLLINPAIDRLVILPAGSRATEQSSELLASRGMAAMIQEMRARYDERVLVVDLPPVLESADALAFLPLADTTLVVVEEHGTRIDDMAAMSELLSPFELAGCLMSRKSAR